MRQFHGDVTRFRCQFPQNERDLTELVMKGVKINPSNRKQIVAFNQTQYLCKFSRWEGFLECFLLAINNRKLQNLYKCSCLQTAYKWLFTASWGLCQITRETIGRGIGFLLQSCKFTKHRSLRNEIEFSRHSASLTLTSHLAPLHLRWNLNLTQKMGLRG